MKLLDGKSGLTLRLGTIIVALFVGQQAMAAGTRAGTSIDNTASVDYFVNGIDQTDIPSNTVTFVVDRRVDFTLTPLSTPDLEIVSPGTTNAFVDFLLTNMSNSDLDFLLTLAQTATNDPVDGSGNDSADMAAIDYAVVTASDPTPTRTTGAQFVDELAADDSVRIRVWGDAALTMLNGQISGVDLTATAAEAGAAGPGTALDWTVGNTDLGVENVDVVGADGVRVGVDGFIVQSAAITVVKDYSVIDDGFGGTTNPIPGAIVEYTITITNASTTTTADSVEITDTLNTDLAFLPNWSGTDDMTFTVNAGTPTGCTEEADADGCERSGQDLTFDGITIGISSTLVVTYRVTILDPVATP